MFHKFLSMLLCACMLTGSVSNAAYAMSPTMNIQTTEVAEETTEAVTETENVGSTDIPAESQTAETGVDGVEESGEITTETVTTETSETSMEATEELPESTMAETQTSAEETSNEVVTTEAVTETVDATEEGTDTVTTEETATEVETTEETTVEATTEEETQEKVSASDVKAAEDTVLTLGEAVEVELSSSYSDRTWLKYTAQESGFYNMAVTNNGSSNAYIYVYRNAKSGSYNDYEYLYSSDTAKLVSYAEQGDVLYFGMYASGTGVTVNASISTIETVSSVEGENGVYTGTYGDYTLTTTLDPGYRRVDFNIALTASDENTLSGYYYVDYCLRSNSGWSETFLQSYNGYSMEKYISGLTKNTSYTMDIVLKNSSYEPIAVFEGMTFQTKNTDQPAVIEIGEVTYSSVTITYEAVQDNVRAYYAPENSGEKNSISSYEKTNTYTGLAASTQYRVWAEDYDGNVLVEESFTTETSTLTAVYALEVVSPSTVTANVSVTGIGDNASYLYLYYQYTDSEGKVIQNYTSEYVREDEETGEKAVTFDFSIYNLLASTNYSFEMWIQEEYGSYAPKYQYVEREITTSSSDLNVDEITFTVSQDETTLTTLNYSFVLPQVPAEGEEYAIYYRIKEENEPWTHVITSSVPGTLNGYESAITGLVQGLEYEVKLLLPNQGVYKTISCQMGTAAYHPQVTDDTDVFDSNLTYTIPEEELNAEDTWTVSLSYLSPGNEDYSSLTSGLSLNAENGYSIQLNSNDYSYSNLRPASDYTFRWQLYKNGSLCHVMLQPVTTDTLTITATQGSIGINTAVYTFTTTARTEYLKSSEYIYASLNTADKKDVAYKSFRIYQNNQSAEITFEKLEADTEYEIVLTTSDDDVLATFTFITPEDDRILSNAAIIPRINEIELNASLEGTAVDTSYTYIHLYVREQGSSEWPSEYHNYDLYGSAGDIGLYISGLKENTAYEYVYGIGKSYSTTPNYLVQGGSGVVYTLKDDRVLTLLSSTPALDQMTLEFGVTGETAKDNDNYVIAYYREKGTEDDWSRRYISIYGEESGNLTLSNLKEETEYEYVYGFGDSYDTEKDSLKAPVEGIFTTLKDDRTLTLKSVDAYLNNAEFTFNIAGEAAKDNYNYVLMYYRKKGTEDNWTKEYNSLEGTGELTVSIDSGLTENTTYEYVYGIGSEWNTAKDDLKNPQSGEFTTIVDDRELTFKKVAPRLTSVDVTIELIGEAANGRNYVFMYYREKGTENEWTYDYNYLNEAGETTLSFYGLKENTAYEYVLGLGNSYYTSKDELIKTQTGEFKTLLDDRSLSVEVQPAVHNATINATIDGKAAEGIWTYLTVYYKEKGSDKEDSRAFSCYGNGTYSTTIYYFGEEELKENTEYEYTIGYAEDTYVPKDQLKGTVTGTFKTLADARKLTNVGAQAGYNSARIGATVTNNQYGIRTYVHYFYRVKGAEQWNHSSQWYGTNQTSENSILYTDLQQGTEYEYAVVLSDGTNVDSPNDVTKEGQKVTGTFATKVSKYSLSVTPDNTKTTYNKGYVNVTASGDNADERLYVNLQFTNGQGSVFSDVTLSQAQGYKNTAILTGLNSATEYTLVAATLAVDENGSRITIGQLSPEAKFTTKEVVKPATIKLPVEKLYLNAAGGGTYISAQQLNASVTPAKAVKAITWTSSDETVAIVNNGYVQAVGTGTAVITAASAYDSAITDTCEVIVKNYVIAKETENGTTEIVTDSIILYEDDILSGYGLYEVTADGTLTKVETANVSVERSLVAEWTDNTLCATAKGATKVYFEANGVKAVMNVTVLEKAIGFGLVGLNTSNEAYPAISMDDGKYEVAKKDGLTYTVVGEITPQQVFDPTAFVWTSSSESIATVDNYGVITPVATGSVTITAKPAGETSPYVQAQASVTLEIKAVPEAGENIPTVYALTNSKANMLLEDVKFPAEWGEGWQWRDPKTPLYTLPVNNDYYAFEAYYDGGDMYAYEGLVNVYISKLESVYAYEVDGDHNNVIEVSTEDAGSKDTILLSVSESHMGRISPNHRFTLPQVDGLGVEYDPVSGCYSVTALKEGVYELAPTIEFVETDRVTGEEKVTYTMSGSYKLKAVAQAQVAAITFSTEDEDVKIDAENGMIRLNFTEELKGKQFTLSAKVTDQNGNELSTPLKWKTTDKTVAAVSYSKNASQQATITVKGSGHAVLMVTASDAAAYSTELDVEIRDYKPRINTAKTTVNIAYDYDSGYGRNLASLAYGTIELAEVYGDAITNISVYKNDGTVENNLSAAFYSSDNGVREYIVCPTKEEIPTGKYECQLLVTTENCDEPYTYPMNVTVVNSAPKVTAKMGDKLNLFYKTTNGNLYLNIKGVSNGVSNISWSDNSANAAGFSINSYTSGFYSGKGYRVYIYQDNVQVINRKLVDPAIATGTLTVTLNGVRKPIEIKNFKIGYNYKKPSLKARQATSSIAPSVGMVKAGFYIYDPVKKTYVSYNTSATSYWNYSELSYDNDNVSAYPSGSYIYTTYSGTNKKETVTYKLDSKAWREPLTVKQTIKVVSPKAVMNPSTLTYNKSYKSTVSTSVYVGNIATSQAPAWMDVEVKGTNAKSKALVENDVFDITSTEYAASPVKVTLNQTKLMELAEQNGLKAGTYQFKVTPYYRNQDTGATMKLNTLSMKLKVVDKPVTVKVTPKGSIDLAKSTASYSNINSISLNPKFSNMGDRYQVIGAELKGEYSKYFTIINRYGGYCYLKNSGYGELKANQKYKLSMEYTIQTPDGDTFKVQSNVFTVTPKQSAPKVSVYGNNQTLYAASALSRYYTITVPSYYSIESAGGSIDCNKDGKADIKVAANYINGTNASIKVSILDKDAVIATAKGKTYTIPVTVKVVGRDGISKDAKVNIKVKVKR